MSRRVATVVGASVYALVGAFPLWHTSLWLRREVPGTGSNPVTISGRPVVRKELA